MESSGDSSYRIPPSVFAPDTPSKTKEWSIASSESLFSIQMGMSFSREEFLWRSGELGSPTGSLPPLQPANDEAMADGKGDDVVITGTNVGICGVSRDDEDLEQKRPYSECHVSHYSVDSEKSFAFPILTGHYPCSFRDQPKLNKEQQQMSEPQPNSEEAKDQQAEPQPAQTTWFSYFACCNCTFCS